MKKQNKRKTKSFKSSILLLLLMAVLLISSTYAWFTANTTVTVSSIDVHVGAVNGLQISTDGATWKSTITNEDITTKAYTGNTNSIPTELQPISTSGGVASGLLNLYYGQVTTDGNNYLTSAQKDSEGKDILTGKYIVFDLFFKVDQDETIYLTPNSKVVPKNAGDTKGLQNCARVAFLTEGHGADGASALALTGATEAKIWEPNYDVHTENGKNSASDNYGITTTLTGGSQLAYNGLKDVFDASAKVPAVQKNWTVDTTKFGAVTTAYSSEAGWATGNKSFASLTKGVTKVRIYMWVEGQDVDCENSASGTDISYNLQFTKDA